ncbi:putative aldouronate transport system permease protein [Pullulanibacillus pueri]|uniref:Putative ABC transporter permease protein YtcP n=1 Tax=Pullulanibacillus pueri TaxID=1437324 RepID=A0A8J3EKK8_9BACL|nr:carbohydrate ABC transporter permease [Pullulanibacillus pueri]MBM7681795.1 putative aldouronate transport system permease protein [Pullulanibacillus pueri]GGH76116.1 putative ABC transporter permease protein YtcP [Pullulanibacillus pueri]
MIRLTRGEKIFTIFNHCFLIFLMILMLYPVWYIFMGSFSDATRAQQGGFFLIPAGFSLDAFKAVLTNVSLLSGFKTTLITTVIGTIIGTFLSAGMAYALSKNRLRGQFILSFIVLFTMLFNGGMVPTYLLVKNLGLLNSYWALILPNAIGAWNIFVMMSFFRGIPRDLEESAKIDGANDLTVFFRIVLPISKPVLVTIGLFLAVMYWDDFFSTILYITDKSMWQLQAVLNDVITNTSEAMMKQGVSVSYQQNVSKFTIQMASIVVATIPILIVYPFVQKHFVKGAMIGSIKG